MTSPILWQNEGATVTLFDTPRSIEAAQGDGLPRHLQAMFPMSSSYDSNMPGLASGKNPKNNTIGDSALETTYQTLLENALDEVRKAHHGEWCLPRQWCLPGPPEGREGPHGTKNSKKRKLDETSNEEQISKTQQRERLRPLPDRFLTSLARSSEFGGSTWRIVLPNTVQAIIDEVTRFLCNSSDDLPFSFRITEEGSFGGDFEFHVPPRSSCYLGDCANPTPFRSAIRKQAEQNDSNRSNFDFILLDPPWPNASVKRKRRTPGSSYSTPETLADLRELLFDAKVDILMAEDCWVGMWITNKPAIRDLVLGENGLFECWGVELVEEWIWLKTTVHGEPVLPLDCDWRKPYEVLLMGKKISKDRDAAKSPDIKRRVIISVPDLHSRKLCLKQLIEPLMPDPKNYRALEIFARHLVSGWWSWGDECIKFNYKGCWLEEEDGTNGL